MFYISLMGIINQKQVVDSQQVKRRESAHATTENHQFTKQGYKEEERNKRTTKQPENNKWD